MKIAVKVMPRKEVLDTQGRAVLNTLKSHGHALEACVVGKYIVLDMPDSMSKADGLQKAKEMCELMLCNPLIETFETEAL